MPTKTQERRLSALEKKYDKASAPTRVFYTDRQEINSLVLEGVIDRDHGQLLLDNASKAYRDAEAARKAKGAPKRQLTPFGALMHKKRPSAFNQAASGAMEMSEGITQLVGMIPGAIILYILFMLFFG